MSPQHFSIPAGQTILQLSIIPDISGGTAFASLA